MLDSFKPADEAAIILERANARGELVSRYLSILSLILPTAAAAQQPGSAGATRPKLEVLQSLPEAQLFPLMNLVSQSLGVRCEHCHVQANPDYSRTPSNLGGWVWESDDKPSKRRAREMMKMVVSVNALYFAGEARVTCNSCHRGTLHPARLPALPPPAPGSMRTPSPTRLPSADRVLAAYAAAVGGGDAAARGVAMSIRGWDDRPEGRYGRFEITVAGSDRYRITVTTPEGTTNQALDGDVAWAATNDRVVRLSSPTELARMRRVAMRYRPVKEQPANLRVVGIERVDDHDAYVLEAEIDAVTTQRSYFDVITGLLRRELTLTETMLLPLEEQIDYDEYRDVGGLQLPHRIRISDGASYSTTTRTIVEIRRNIPLDAALFRPPSARR
jgi:hypothetical protein